MPNAAKSKLLRYIRNRRAGFRLARKVLFNSCTHFLQSICKSISGFYTAARSAENSNSDTHADACCEGEYVSEHMTLTTTNQARSSVREVTRTISHGFFHGCRRVACLIQKVCARFK